MSTPVGRLVLFPEWVALKGAHVERVKYFPNVHDQRGDLVVEYRTGKSYRFKDVPQIRFEKMLRALSPEGYFLEEIRGEYESEFVK